MKSVSPVVLLVWSAVLVFTGTAFAQSSSGTITGRVLDTSGQSVPGATVALTKNDTREKRTAPTTLTGDFVFTALQPLDDFGGLQHFALSCPHLLARFSVARPASNLSSPVSCLNAASPWITFFFPRNGRTRTEISLATCGSR